MAFTLRRRGDQTNRHSLNDSHDRKRSEDILGKYIDQSYSMDPVQTFFCAESVTPELTSGTGVFHSW